MKATTKKICSLAVVITLLMSVFTAQRTALGETTPDPGITVSGSTNGWVGSAGLKVTAYDGSAYLAAKYKISTSSAENYTNLNNSIPSANNVSVPLTAGTGLYLIIQAGDYEGVYGPYSVDLTPPEVTTSFGSNAINYTITDANGVKLADCGYVFNDVATRPAAFTSSINNLTGSLTNSKNNRYCHILAVDIAGNETWKVVDMGDFSGIVFSSTSYGITLTVDSSIVLSSSTFTFMDTNGQTISSGTLDSTSKTFTFPGTSSYYVIVDAVNKNGVHKSVTSPTYSGANRDNINPTATISESGNGMKIVLADIGSGVDLTKSYYISKGVQTNFTELSTIIKYKDYFFEKVYVHVQDRAGNVLETLLNSYYLPSSSLNIDMSYDTKNAYISVPPEYYCEDEDLFDEMSGGYYTLRMKSKNQTLTFARDNNYYFDVYCDASFVEKGENNLSITWDLDDPLNPTFTIKNADLFNIDVTDQESSYRVGKTRWQTIKREKTTIDLNDYEPGTYKVEISLLSTDRKEHTFERSIVIPAPAHHTFENTTTGVRVIPKNDTTLSGMTWTVYKADGTKVNNTASYYASGNLGTQPIQIEFPDTTNRYYVGVTYTLNSKSYTEKSHISRATQLGSTGNANIQGSATDIVTKDGITFERLSTGIQISIGNLNAWEVSYALVDATTKAVIGAQPRMSNRSELVLFPANVSSFYIVVTKYPANSTASEVTSPTYTVGTGTDTQTYEKNGIKFDKVAGGVQISSTLTSNIQLYYVYRVDTNSLVDSKVSINSKTVTVPTPTTTDKYYIVAQNTSGIQVTSPNYTAGGGTSPTPTPNTDNTSGDRTNPNWQSHNGMSYIPGYTKFITGYSDGTFKYGNPITRAEFATILSNITTGGSGTEPGASSYSDVESGAWYYNAIDRLSKNGAVFGTDGKFRPNDYITRGEAAAFLNRLKLNKPAYTAIPLSDITDYVYKQDITEATTKGLISGYSDGTFKPNYMISRVEAVVIINRALGRNVTAESIQGVEGVKLPPDMQSSQWGYYDVVGAMNSHEVKEWRNGHEVWLNVK